MQNLAFHFGNPNSPAPCVVSFAPGTRQDKGDFKFGNSSLNGTTVYNIVEELL